MSARSVRGAALVVVLVAGLVALCGPFARADEPAPATPPSAAPAAPAAPGADAPKTMTNDELEARMRQQPAAATALGLLKWVPAIAGLIVVVLRFARRSDERKGLVAPLRRAAVPPRAFRLEVAIGLSLFAAIGGGFIVLPIYSGMDGLAHPKELPLEVAFGAQAAGMIPVAIATAFAIRRAWARRRQASSAVPSGDASPVPASAWPARSGLREGLVAFLVASLVMVSVSLATQLVMYLMGVPSEPQPLVLRVIEPKAPYEPWMIAGFGVLLAPITEEFVFRGLLYPAIRDRSSRLVGALLSSALFGAVHQSWTAGPALFCLAMLLCYLYERTGSVWPGVLVHVLNNATSLLPLFLLR